MATDALRIDRRRVLGRTSPRLFGGFLEHMGRCVYGGLHDPDSPHARPDGLRRDVIEALRRLGFTNLRYPGGNFVCTYRWRDGVGPPAERPARWNPAWRQEEPNRFGTGEFLGLCEELGVEPYLCFNLGTGGPEEAAAWVEYVNGRGASEATELRRRHGRAEPWGVRLWGLGNEVDGFWNVGQRSAEQYAWLARETAKFVHAVDPGAELVACGSTYGRYEWDLRVLEELYPHVTHLAVHVYVGQKDLAAHLGAPLVLEDRIERAEAAIRLVASRFEGRPRPGIAVDEWNVWYKDMNLPWIEERYDQADAVVVAGLLLAMLRRPETVTLANLAQCVNVIAPIRTDRERLFLQTIAHPFALLRRHLEPNVLETRVETDTYSARVFSEHDPRKPLLPREVPRIDALATLSDDGRRLAVAALSRDLERERVVEIEAAGFGRLGPPRVFELAADDPRAANDFDHPERVRPVERQGEPDGRLRLAPCSFQLALYEVG